MKNVKYIFIVWKGICNIGSAQILKWFAEQSKEIEFFRTERGNLFFCDFAEWIKYFAMLPSKVR